MPTPETDKQPAAETLEEIAERITAEVAKICGCAWESCTRTRTETKAAILSALRNERERCAKVLDERARELRRMTREPVLRLDVVTRFRNQADECDRLTRTIREGK